ncbi:hypothetical protein BDP27DRAFT_1430539 [Rhodocollybia butyracea]|uniref:Flavin-containing monooxygenase n=1 Tax=Rhodocollybia butyracea TaxID=206335 RepID=A0A9P5U024_9AGAR|nr:hypothetical protein BDP27DRAFT_1430539 [Rhodocollybia butyracea]
MDPKRILVIGGGVCGLVTLRNLIERGSFDKVELVERRDNVGGVWYLDESDPEARWQSPAYPNLVGNVLPEFLSFSESPFPEPPSTPHQPYPTLKETHDYLRLFAEKYLERGNIRLNIEVVRVEELDAGKGWEVTMRDWSLPDHAGREFVSVWDAVAGCTGWFDDPQWPQTEGMEELKQKGLAMHAKSYRGPQKYAGKRALIIGNGNSSNDIASHLVPLAQTPVYRSIRRPNLPHFVSLPDPRIVDVPPVKRFIHDDNNKVTVELKDDTKIEDIDIVFVGSGTYRILDSFISIIPLMSQARAPQPRRIPSLHKHILYAYNPTLAFIGTVMPYTPFTIADVSSTWLTLVWSNQVPFPPSPEARLLFEKERIQHIERQREIEAAETGREASSLFTYSALGASEEDYAAGLKAAIVAAKPELESVLPEWSEKRRTYRQSMYEVKRQSLLWLKKQKDDLEQAKANENGSGLANGVLNGSRS